MTYLSLNSCLNVASAHTFANYPAKYAIRKVRLNSFLSLLRNKFFYSQFFTHSFVIKPYCSNSYI